MKKKLETRGRKPKLHKPVSANFDDVLTSISRSKYKDEKTIKKRKR